MSTKKSLSKDKLAVDEPKDKADMSSILSEDTPSPLVKNKGADIDEDEEDQELEAQEVPKEIKVPGKIYRELMS